MKPLHNIFLLIVIVLISVTFTGSAHAEVPVRVSIKFILDANGNRPAAGRLNTDEEINAEYNAAIDILSRNISELTVERIEFVDLAGLSQWYSTSAATTAGRDALRTAAIASPATYHWRTDAVNIYINGGPSSAISNFPPNNNIILMNQGCTNTPSCILHELGHSLNLMHTHETATASGDACSDTLVDNESWSKDQVAQNNYGCLYANCTAGQRAAVDMVFNNIMSYHVSETQNRISPCQMDRISSQSYTDRNWLLAKLPVYVNSGLFVLFPNGSFSSPFTSLQGALNAGGLANRVLVLQQGAYTMSQEAIDFNNVELVTRSGPSSFSHSPGAQSYVLPVDIENSKNPQVRSEIKTVQEEDRSARNVEREAETASKNAVKADQKISILANAKKQKKIHHDNAVKAFTNAEQFAEGDEKLAIQMEMAQRYRDAGDCEKARQYFTKVAETTNQPGLKQEALLQIENCGKKNPAKVK